MKYLRYILFFGCIAAALAACNRKPVRPEFVMLNIDTLIAGPDNDSQVAFGFVTIANAERSPVLQQIEKSNIEFFFGLEEFDGTAREAADAAIRQLAEEFGAEEGSGLQGETFEITAEADAHITDSLLTYIVSRWSYTGGAHGIYGAECRTYSLSGGYELTLADLFPEVQLQRMEKLLREKLYQQYATDSDEGLSAAGFFPEYIALTENFMITPDGITFFYNPYEIGCYALGAVEVTYTREELEETAERAKDEIR